MRRLLGGVIAALIVAASSLAGPAHAVPAFCTGTITTVATGDFVPGSFLVNLLTGNSTGNCVLASDKYFGGFKVGGAITGAGSTGWLFTMGSGPADVTIGFQGLVGSNMTGSVDYSVEINPLNSNGALISALEKDFTFNSIGAGSTATLKGMVSAAIASFTGGDITTGFQCTRTASTATCPQTGFFDPFVADLTIDEMITTGANTNVTALTDTLFQAVPGVPEPSSLALLGAALLGLFGIGYHRHQR